MVLVALSTFVVSLFWLFVLVLVGLLLTKNELFIKYLKSVWSQEETAEVEGDEQIEVRKLAFWNSFSATFSLAFSALFDGIKTRRPRNEKTNAINGVLVLIGQLMILVGFLSMFAELIGFIVVLTEASAIQRWR